MIYNPILRDKKELRLCEDGSKTLFSHEFKEPYHSTKDGALHESLQKHVLPALLIKNDNKSLTILDICFGLGYNSFATIQHILKMELDVKIHIISPEFDKGLLESLSTFDYPEEFDNIKHIIEAISRDLYYEDEQFKIEILLGDARKTIKFIREKIDIIYQDAFSPSNNPLLWTREFFRDIRAKCNDNALLTTYSTSASTRLALYENGFYIYIHYAEKTRYSTIASLAEIEGFEYIDMELKKVRNTISKSLRDIDYI